MEKEGKLFPCSQDPASRPYHEPDGSIPHNYVVLLYDTLQFCPYSTTRSSSSSVPLKRFGRVLKAAAKSDLQPHHVCPSVRREKRDSQVTDFRKIKRVEVLLKFVNKFRFW
jgi:hypothetical protein